MLPPAPDGFGAPPVPVFAGGVPLALDAGEPGVDEGDGVGALAGLEVVGTGAEAAGVEDEGVVVPGLAAVVLDPGVLAGDTTGALDMPAGPWPPPPVGVNAASLELASEPHPTTMLATIARQAAQPP